MSRKHLWTFAGLAALLALSGVARGQARVVPFTWTDTPVAALGIERMWVDEDTFHMRGFQVISRIVMELDGGAATAECFVLLDLNAQWQLPTMTGPISGKCWVYASYDPISGLSQPIGAGECAGVRSIVGPDLWCARFRIAADLAMGSLGTAHMLALEDVYTDSPMPTGFLGLGVGELRFPPGR